MSLLLAPSLALALAGSASAGLMDAPGSSYQVRYSADWYVTGDSELSLEAEPDASTLELLPPFAVGEGSLTMALRAALADRRPGAETSTISFTGLGGREGVVIHTTRMRGLRLFQMTWAAMPLGDGDAALLALRYEGTAQSTARSSFLEIAGTALPAGILKDLPPDELEELYRRELASPAELVQLQGLSVDGGVVRGLVLNGSELVLQRASLLVEVRDSSGHKLHELSVAVVPGAAGRALAAGGSLEFSAQVGALPQGRIAASLVELEWAQR